MTLIERLRGAEDLEHMFDNLANEAADELERLTKENAKLNDELTAFRTGHQGACYACEPVAVTNRNLRADLAALKAQSTEPVATIRTWHKDGDLHAELTDWEYGIDDLPDGQHTLYTTPPTATALVADFKLRVKEAIRNERLVDDTGTEGDEAYNTALDHAENAIESLPLITDFNQGEKK